MIVVADELIVFTTLDTIPVVWMLLKILTNHWIDTEAPPKKVRSLKKAA